jgi:hypothetical protein
LETLRRCFPSRILQILDELPTTLDETYERVLSEIPEENWKHAHHLILCLVFSFRPLHIDELAEVFAIGFDPEMTPDPIQGWRPENTEDAVLSACSSLIAIVEVGDYPVVQISHCEGVFHVKSTFHRIIEERITVLYRSRSCAQNSRSSLSGNSTRTGRAHRQE